MSSHRFPNEEAFRERTQAPPRLPPSALLSAEAPVLKNGRIISVKVGSYKTPGILAIALKSFSINTSLQAARIMRQKNFLLAERERVLEVIILSVRDLGFAAEATYSDIREWAPRFGLKLCPAEVGPALRIMYRSQKRGERVRVAMPTLSYFRHLPAQSIFVVEQNEMGACLDIDEVRPHEDLYGPDALFAFLYSRRLLLPQP